ncbi:MAG: hypothetical protein R2761_13715 [Acidimicrobiales bacterium]
MLNGSSYVMEPSAESRHRLTAQRFQFERPGRTYYLLTGPVAAAGKLRYPDSDEWRNPDLFWPDDQRWFVATDVDFWSLYVGGSNGFIAELGGTLSTHAEPIGLDAPLEIEAVGRQA